jgi:hypothetical protein
MGQSRHRNPDPGIADANDGPPGLDPGADVDVAPWRELAGVADQMLDDHRQLAAVGRQRDVERVVPLDVDGRVAR